MANLMTQLVTNALINIYIYIYICITSKKSFSKSYENLKVEVMTLSILLVSFFAAACHIADAQMYPIQAQDMREIVESVKKDVHEHLKMSSQMSFETQSEPAELKTATVVEDIDEFLTVIQDSINHHLVRNLGNPEDSQNGELNVYSKVTTEDTVYNTESAPDDSSDALSESTDSLEPSSQVYEIRVGSAKGIPGVNFPAHTDIPTTSFSCSDKPYLPGFYADPDTECQVFHVCLPDKRESFLCPMGTTFNQALLVCDYWYNSNCSLAPHYYSINKEMESDPTKDDKEYTSAMIKNLLEKAESGSTSKPEFTTGGDLATSVLSFLTQFMPIKAKISVYPKTERQRQKIVASISTGESNKSRPKSQLKKTAKSLNVPLSEHEKSPTTDNRMTEFKSQLFAVKLTEALDRILIDVKNDISVAKLQWYVETTVNLLKSYLDNHVRGLPQRGNFEPGTELYEYDLVTTEAFEKLPSFVRQLLREIITFMEEVKTTRKVKREIPHEVHEPVDFKQASRPRLNPRFIMKPSVAGQKDSIKVNMKNLKTEDPLKVFHKSRSNIDPQTKKTLLKNYIKLYKTRCV